MEVPLYVDDAPVVRAVVGRTVLLECRDIESRSSAMVDGGAGGGKKRAVSTLSADRRGDD